MSKGIPEYDSDGGWKQWSMFVLKEIERLNKELSSLDARLDKIVTKTEMNERDIGFIRDKQTKLSKLIEELTKALADREIQEAKDDGKIDAQIGEVKGQMSVWNKIWYVVAGIVFSGAISLLVSWLRGALK